jgi:predicted DNA-binding transcriptional regulator AlpA
MPKITMYEPEAQVERGQAAATVRRKLSVSDAAQLAGVSESHLNKLRSTGGGPAFFKIGARVVYDVFDLDQWLDQHRRRSTSDQGPETALVGGVARRGIESPHVRGDRP